MAGIHWVCLLIGFLLGTFFGSKLLGMVGVKGV
jgi:hypothetical protein